MKTLSIIMSLLSIPSVKAMNISDRKKGESYPFMLKENNHYPTARAIAAITTIPHKRFLITGENSCEPNQSSKICLYDKKTCLLQNSIPIEDSYIKKIACTEHTVAVLRGSGQGGMSIDLFTIYLSPDLFPKGTLYTGDWIKGFSWSPDGKKLGCSDTLYGIFYYIPNWPLTKETHLDDEMKLDVEKCKGIFSNIVWDNNKKLREVYHKELIIDEVKTNKDNQCACTQHKKKSVVLMDLDTKKYYSLKDKNNRKRAQIKAIAFNPEGNYLATGDQKGNIVIWDVKKQTIIAKQYRSQPIISINWDDESELIVGTDSYRGNIFSTLRGYAFMEN